MTTVRDLFDAAGVARAGAVRWGERVPLRSPGVYVVATTQHADDERGFGSLPLRTEALSELLRQRPGMSIDAYPASHESLADRLHAMFPVNEPVLYVGLTTDSLWRRTWDYYRTPIGARKPHAGGWPIQMLVHGSDLWVHYGAAHDPAAAERAMVLRFVSGVPAEVAASLIDPGRPLPFANLVEPGGKRKRHGIRGAVEKKKTSPGGPAQRSGSANRASRKRAVVELKVEDIELRERILEAIVEYDRLGQSAFLEKYGWERARSYFLLFDGNYYDSKAILGAALRIEPGPSEERDRLSGGKNGAARILERLGFAIVSTRGIDLQGSAIRSGSEVVCGNCFMVVAKSGGCSCD